GPGKTIPPSARPAASTRRSSRLHTRSHVAPRKTNPTTVATYLSGSSDDATVTRAVTSTLATSASTRMMVRGDDAAMLVSTGSPPSAGGPGEVAGESTRSASRSSIRYAAASAARQTRRVDLGHPLRLVRVLPGHVPLVLCCACSDGSSRKTCRLVNAED